MRTPDVEACRYIAFGTLPAWAKVLVSGYNEAFAVVGDARCEPLDWIVRHDDGTFMVYDNETFQRLYEVKG